jgi:hypothetical protein
MHRWIRLVSLVLPDPHLACATLRYVVIGVVPHRRADGGAPPTLIRPGVEGVDKVCVEKGSGYGAFVRHRPCRDDEVTQPCG